MNDSVRSGLLGAYRRILRPLIRILIRHGVHYDSFAEISKSVFVESAQLDFGQDDREMTTARISILTGLSRHEVEDQQAILSRGDLIPRGTLNEIMHLLVGWHSDARFTGPYGLPLDLPFEAREGSSFSELVSIYAPQVDAEALLEQLVRANVVEKTPLGKLKVLARAYIPDSLHTDWLERLGKVVCNFLGTLETNMEKSQRGAGRFERIVYADEGLSPAALREFDRLLRDKGQQFLVELDNWLSAQAPPKESPEGEENTPIRTGVGIYHYIEMD
jgi:Family of unknown function (DUF6502)